jgi:hypothetical protein
MGPVIRFANLAARTRSPGGWAARAGMCRPGGGPAGGPVMLSLAHLCGAT